MGAGRDGTIIIVWKLIMKYSGKGIYRIHVCCLREGWDNISLCIHAGGHEEVDR
jgi:hypothetical protein